jgi:hypothetical protein
MTAPRTPKGRDPLAQPFGSKTTEFPALRETPPAKADAAQKAPKAGDWGRFVTRILGPAGKRQPKRSAA